MEAKQSSSAAIALRFRCPCGESQVVEVFESAVKSLQRLLFGRSYSD